MNGNELTKRELEPFPRGPRGSERNLFRAVLWMCFRNFYSRKRDATFPTREAVMAFCVEWKQKRDPSFDPYVIA
jgi:hypothetical protein